MGTDHDVCKVLTKMQHKRLHALIFIINSQTKLNKLSLSKTETAMCNACANS